MADLTGRLLADDADSGGLDMRAPAAPPNSPTVSDCGAALKGAAKSVGRCMGRAFAGPALHHALPGPAHGHGLVGCPW